MNVQSVLKMYTRDKWSLIYIPSIILFSSFFVNIIVSFLIPSDEPFYTGGISSLMVYMFVFGILSIAHLFPFAIGLSVRRIDFFTGNVIMGLISSTILAVLLYIFSVIENSTNGWGNRLHFFHFPYVNDGTIWEQIVMYILLITMLYFTGSLIASFFLRYGGKGMLISALVIVLLGTIATLLVSYYDAWIDIFNWFVGKTAVGIAYWFIPFILIYLIASYFFLKRSTI